MSAPGATSSTTSGGNGDSSATVVSNSTASNNNNSSSSTSGTTSTQSTTGRRNRGRFQNRSSAGGTSQFKGAISTIETLATKAEKRGIEYASFLKSLHQHVITTFNNPKDVAIAVTDFADPLHNMASELPTVRAVRQSMGMIPEAPVPNETGEEKLAREERNDEQAEAVRDLMRAEMKIFADRRKCVTNNLTALWGVIMGQCTPALQEELRAEDAYEGKATSYDSIWLLKTLQRVTAGMNKSNNAYYSLFHALKDFYTIRQKDGESVEDYFRRFEAAQDLVVLSNGAVTDISKLFATELKSNAQTTEAATVQKFLAIAFIEQADSVRYKNLWTELKNNLVHKRDSYPTSVAEAVHMLTHWNPTTSNSGNNSGNNRNGRSRRSPHVGFIQGTGSNSNQAPTPGSDGSLSPHITCFKCNRTGHYASVCPEADTQFQGMQLSFTQRTAFLEEQEWHDDDDDGYDDEHEIGSFTDASTILIDSGSTFNSFNSASLLSDIAPCDGMRAYSNGGSLDYHHMGTVNLFPAIEAYYNAESLANILSLSCVSNFYRVTMDSQNRNCLTVHVTNDSVLHFQQCGVGLYRLDSTAPAEPKHVQFVQQSTVSIDSPSVPPVSRPIAEPKEDNLNNSVSAYTFFSTVASNKEFFSRLEIEGADRARVLQGRLGWPSDQLFKEAIRDNLVMNADITVDDINRAEAIYGKSVPLIKGKMVRKRTEHLSNVTRVQIPAPLFEHHPDDELDIDFLYIQGAPYLLSKTHKIKFQAVQCFNKISNKVKERTTYKRGPKEIIAGLKKVIQMYVTRGFTINVVHGDNEFRKLENKLGVHVNICAARQHIPRIERGIRTLKERVRCCWVSLPYRKAPKLMVDENVIDMTSCLNDLPHKEGISRTLSPAMIVLGRNKPDCRRLKVTFGAYCEVYIGTTNTSEQRSVGAIALRPSNNDKGYWFMSLETGRRIHGYIWNELPIPEHVVRRVEELAEDEYAMDLDEDGCPVFEWEIGHEMIDEDDEGDEGDNHGGNEDNDVDEYAITSDEDSDDEDYAGDDSDDDSISDSDNEIEEDIDNDDDDINDDATADDHAEDAEVRADDGTTGRDTGDNPGSTQSEHDQSGQRESTDVDEHVASRSEEAGRPKRVRFKPPTYEPSFTGKSYGATLMSVPAASKPDCRRMYSTAVNVLFNQINEINVVLNQMTATKGLKMFGERAVAAMFKEYKQLDDMKVLGKINPESLSANDKRQALRAINLIKEKRCGKIKGRTCADGRPQRAYTQREDASSPTIFLESLMASLLIDAHEERDVAIFDVPGAYLHAELPPDKFVLLKIEGAFVDIMCDVNPEYLEDVRIENGKKVLYVQILRALYGMIESALLWYSLYVGVLQDEGFVVNPYDKCVANKMIDGKQCTLGWYVDDNKLSHVDPKVVDDILAMVEGYFPGLVVERGEALNFLGMELKFIGNKKVSIGTVKYIKDMAEEFGVDLLKKVSSPAAKWLFTTNDKSPKLKQEMMDKYVRFVAKILWVEKRSRPDVETAVSFLITRIKAPDKDDWCKLVRAMSWLYQTADDVRIVGADDLHEMLTFIDSAHAVHPNMRGHTGGLTTFGTGIIDQKSSKQKMNTRSSTETEVVGTSEYLPKNIFFEMFMEAQGYRLKSNILAEDNESTIRMSKNGRDSCTSNSKHIAIKYFWVTDRIKNGNIKIVHCPTKQMIADYFTKPLQGALFHMFRNVIMGWDHVSTVYTGYDAPKERVENNEERLKREKTENRELVAATTVNKDTSKSEGISKKKSYAEAVKRQNELVLAGTGVASPCDEARSGNSNAKHVLRLNKERELRRSKDRRNTSNE